MPKDNIFENFSRATLERLAEYGLHPTTAGISWEGRKACIATSESICFPWLIVEHKKLEQWSATECYCEAANDATAALVLLRTLARYHPYNIVPSVVTITTVGGDVRVWIAFFDAIQDKYVSVSHILVKKCSLLTPRRR